MIRYAYWHFAQDDKRLGYGDDRPIIVGQKLTVPGPVELCERGLHASPRAIDALAYAPGAYACLVLLSGEIEHGDDKSVATERTVIAAADATNLLFQFAIDCAARAMERVGWTHEDSWNALSIRAAHMQGLADNGDLSAAKSAARSAARLAARSAAKSAAESAAWLAAKSAAESAAESAEREIQNAELERRLCKLLGVK